MKFGHIVLIPMMLLLVTTANCGDDDDKGGTGTTTGTSTTTGTTGATTTTTGTGGGTNDARVQLAHLSPDAPAVDICVRGGAGEFQGPVLREQLQDEDGLAYGEVTGDVTLPARSYTLRFVEPGSTGCETAIPGIPDVEDVSVEAQQRYVFAAIGELAPVGGAAPFQVKVFPGVAEPSQGKARIRAIHAVPDATTGVDVGTVENSTFTPLFTDVKFGNAGQADGKPYVDRDPLMDATLSVRSTGGADDLIAGTVDLAPGAITTVFVIGTVSGDPKPLQALVCTDTGEQQGESLADCTTLPPP